LALEPVFAPGDDIAPTQPSRLEGEGWVG